MFQLFAFLMHVLMFFLCFIIHPNFPICSVSGGRLECTMQSIADNFLNTFTSRSNKSIESTMGF